MSLYLTLYLPIVIVCTLVTVTWDTKETLSRQSLISSFAFSNVLAIMSVLVFHLIYQAIYQKGRRHSMNSETNMIFWLMDPGILPSLLIATMSVLLIKMILRRILYKEIQHESRDYRKSLFLLMSLPILGFIVFASVISVIMSVIGSFILNQQIHWY